MVVMWSGVMWCRCVKRRSQSRETDLKKSKQPLKVRKMYGGNVEWW